MVKVYARLIVVLVCGNSMIFPASTATEGKEEMRAPKSPTSSSSLVGYAPSTLTEKELGLISFFANKNTSWNHTKTIEGSFKHCKVSADGRLLFEFDEVTSEVSIFDLKGNTCLRTFSLEKESSFNFAVSDDLSTIVYATVSGIEVYKLNEGDFYKQHSIEAPEGRYFVKESVAISGDGTLLAYTTFGDTSNHEVPALRALHVWDMVNHTQKCVIEHGRERVLNGAPVVIFDNCSSVATLSTDDAGVNIVFKIFSIATHFLIKELFICPFSAMAGRCELTVSGDNTSLYCCFAARDWENYLHKVLRKWHCDTGEAFTIYTVPFTSGECITDKFIPQLSRNASWLIMNNFWHNRQIGIMNLKTGQVAQSFPSIQRTGLLARDSHDVVMCGRGDIQIWSPAPSSDYEALMTLTKEGEDVYALCNTMEDSEGSYARRGLAPGLPLGIRQLIGSYVARSIAENCAPNRATMRPLAMPPVLPGTSSLAKASSVVETMADQSSPARGYAWHGRSADTSSSSSSSSSSLITP